MEQDEIPAPPAGASGDDVPPPPTQSTVTYNIIGADGKTDPTKYTIDQLKGKNLTADSYVYNKTLGAWKQIKDVPELNSVIVGGTSPESRNKSPQTNNNTTQTTEEKQVESFFTYCPTTKGLLDQAAKKILELTNQDINSAASVEEAEEIRNKAFEKMGEDNKSNLGYCKQELKGSGRGDIQQILTKFEPAIKTLLNKTAADLGKKALTGGVNLLVGLATKKLGGGALTQSGVSNAVAESLIKKNTKNNLIEIYNRKNRRRY
jgi:hypothetical protein